MTWGYAQILPVPGRGTAGTAVEGARLLTQGFARRWTPSTMLRMAPLPVPGRIGT
jgi:hypothetical protein